MRKRGKVMNSSLIDQNIFPQTRCLDIVQRYIQKYLFNFLPSALLPPPHCGEHGKLTCFKKNKHSKLAFTRSIHCEYLIVTALFISSATMLLRLPYRAEGWQSAGQIPTHFQKKPRVWYQQFLTWQDSKLPVELLYYIHCNQRPYLLLHDFICANENRNLPWVNKTLITMFPSFDYPAKQRWHSKEKSQAWLLAQLLYDCHREVYDTYRVSSSAYLLYLSPCDFSESFP